MKEILRYSGCFVCGEKNEIGLKAKFYFENGEACAELNADERFEGYRGIFHGGIISTLLDEAMIKAILAQDKYAVTGEISVRFHLPIHVGDHLRISARVTEKKGRVFYTTAQALRNDCEIVASAQGKCIEARPELRAKLVQSID